MKTYSESDELTQYIWNHYSQFCTETEILANRTIHSFWKARATDSIDLARMIKKRWNHLNTAGVASALADGDKAFRVRTRDRIVQDHGQQIFINRCPKCDKIVETPIACVCMWCAHNWFPKREELKQIVAEKLKKGQK